MALRIPKRLQGDKHPAQRRAPEQEREVAQRIGGRLVRGSGCGLEKGDARRVGMARVECKSTAAKSFSVTREMLLKLEHAAAGAAEIPFMEVEFINKAGERTQAACIMPSWALEILIGKC